MDESRKTYGQVISERSKQNIEMEDDVIEYRRKQEKSIMETIRSTVANSKDQPLYKGKNFYVVLLQNVEKIGQAVRSKVIARRSCPTPVYKQSVWKYHPVSGELEFLWSIPDKILYYHILRNKQKYLADKECRQLAQYVILMESGELLEWVKKENGEKEDVLIRIKPNQEVKEH